jgi:hypothetical protein
MHFSPDSLGGSEGFCNLFLSKAGFEASLFQKDSQLKRFEPFVVSVPKFGVFFHGCFVSESKNIWTGDFPVSSL